MDKKYADQIFQKIQQGTATEQELSLFEDWYLQFNAEKESNYSDLDLEKIQEEGRRNLPVSAPKKIKLWPRFAVAASILLCLSIGVYVYNNDSSDQAKTIKKQNINVAAGGNKATLTLSDGRVVDLSDAQSGIIIGAEDIKYSDGSTLGDISSNPQMLTLTTPKGGEYQITLPDGTNVWLNASSSLKYSPRFIGADRRVELTGEAYFEVVSKQEAPFKVKTAKQEVMVLGTHFNINAYPDERSTTTSLLEGSVRVATEQNTITLSPGEQSALVENTISVAKFNAEEAIAWKEGYFKFKDLTLEPIMRQLSRWYDIEVVYEGAVSTDTFNGTIDRKANLSRILKILEKGGVQFKLEGKKLIVISS